jgi:hypothetical protein
MPVQPLTLALPGGKTCTISPSAKDWPERLVVDIEGGAVPYIDANWGWSKPTNRRALQREANLSEGDLAVIMQALKAWMPEAQAALEADAALPPPPPAAEAPSVLEVVCRQKNQSAGEGSTFAISTPEEMLQLLQRATMPDNCVVEWSPKSLNTCAVLDIDFHAGSHPTQLELLQMGDELSPTPRCWWISTGMGLKAVYWPLKDSVFTAEELAAGAAAQMATHPNVIYHKGTVEIIPRTRHPRAAHNAKGGMKRCGELKTRVPTETFEILASLSHAGATDAEVQEVIEELDFTIGERLSHERCPIDPEHFSSSPNPVVVTETGIYCHSCQGRTGDGFRSWGVIRKMNGLTLSTVPATQPLVDAAKHLVHYNHAWYLFENLLAEVPERYRRTLYSALLKIHHGRDLRIRSAFSDFPFVRGEAGWLSAQTLRLVKPLSRLGVACLPSAQIVVETEEGPEVKPDPIKVEAYTNIDRLDGWTPLAGAPFVQIYFQHNADTTLNADTNIMRAVPRQVYSDKRVHYVPAKDRLPLAECERRINEYLPGINFNYLKALIVLMGAGESGRGALPVLWAKGETGAGKTVHANVVCSMYGEPVTSLSGLEEDKLAEGVAEAHEQSRLLVFDDPFKDSKKFPVLHRFWLQVTNRKLSFHKLYVGHINAHIDGAILIADRDDHGFFTNDKQFGRRCYRIHLRDSVQDWQAMGRDANRWWHTSDALREAAEGLHSWVVDEFFASGDARGIGEKLAKFGVVRLDREDGYDSSESRERKWQCVTELVKQLVADGGSIHGDEIAKRVGVGFVEIHWSAAVGVSDLCTQLVEALGAVELNAYNLQRAVDDVRDMPFQVKDGMKVKLDVKALGKDRVFIRIAQDGLPNKSRSRALNGECFAMPLVPVAMPAPPPPVQAAPTKPVVFEPQPGTREAEAESPRRASRPPRAQVPLPPGGGAALFSAINAALRGVTQ